MPLTGQLFIGRERVATSQTFRAANPTTASLIDPPFSSAGSAEVERACQLASEAFDQYRALDNETRAKFLETIGDRIMALGDELLERANAESGLPLARLTGERGRTVGQLRLFADELRKGGWQGVRIDPAMPDRKPLPRADLRQRKSRSARSSCSAPAISRSRSPSPAATPPPRLRLAVPSSSRSLGPSGHERAGRAGHH